ncbi:MAG: LicD family protein [Clostridia bacterium]|nr:LicD family protein [Clostridia bacterium]
MKTDIYYQNVIASVYSDFLKKSDCFSHFVLLGEDGDYFFETLKYLFSTCDTKSVSCNDEHFLSDNFCVISVFHSAEDKDSILAKLEKTVFLPGCQKCLIFDNNTLESADFLVSEREYCVLNDNNVIFEKAKFFLRSVPVVYFVYDEIIGPGCGFDNELEKINSTGRIVIENEDVSYVSGYTYITDALFALIYGFSGLKNGNVYNISSFSASIAEIKQKIYNMFKEKFSVSCSLDSCESPKTKALCSLKIKKSGLEFTAIDDAVFCIVSSYFDLEYDYKKRLPQYCSKLELLKKVELDILKEIDRICKKHNIKYFLTGGSLLGAIRYGKSIPWDDDLDIGMLRSDFEKFRRVCPDEIDRNKFAYASYTTEENCHYLFDKIRLKNTYFSTEFSSDYKIQDGVFVDIFVYDTTSESEKMQRLHINLVKTAIRFLNIKWTGKANRNMNGYMLSKLLGPFIRLMSFGMLHKFSEKSLKFFNKKDSAYLIDGTGLNINRGAFRKTCLEKTKEIVFEGMTVPVPENYDEFLKHVYGDKYLEEPPLYMRSGTHDFVRLDLGEYVTDNSSAHKEQSLDGELFSYTL